MAHHKRGKAKRHRAGCIMCKPHKSNGADRKLRRPKDKRADINAAEQISDAS